MKSVTENSTPVSQNPLAAALVDSDLSPVQVGTPQGPRMKAAFHYDIFDNSQWFGPWHNRSAVNCITLPTITSHDSIPAYINNLTGSLTPKQLAEYPNQDGVYSFDTNSIRKKFNKQGVLSEILRTKPSDVCLPVLDSNTAIRHAWEGISGEYMVSVRALVKHLNCTSDFSETANLSRIIANSPNITDIYITPSEDNHANIEAFFKQLSEELSDRALTIHLNSHRKDFEAIRTLAFNITQLGYEVPEQRFMREMLHDLDVNYTIQEDTSDLQALIALCPNLTQLTLHPEARTSSLHYTGADDKNILAFLTDFKEAHPERVETLQIKLEIKDGVKDNYLLNKGLGYEIEQLGYPVLR